jgi:hypothetical protein
MTNEFLNDLILSPIPEISDAANLATNYLRMYTDKEISQEEFDDLITDLANIDNIYSQMLSVEVKSELMRALNLILTLKAVTNLV